MKTRIYIGKWLELKPYHRQASTDMYYLRLCNEVKEVLIQVEYFILQKYLDKEALDLLSCFLVSYFEDIISETHIWSAFVKKHTALYGKELPFYPAGEYYEGEINEQDIAFLVWYFLNTIREEKFISPYNEFIEDIASDVMDIFDEEYEYAPENETLKAYYRVVPAETDFYIVRNCIDNILFKSYLFCTDTRFRLLESEEELLEGEFNIHNENMLLYLNENRDSFLHSRCTRLLSMKGKEWAAEVLGKSHPLYADLYNMSQKILGFFLYKGQNDTHITLEHIASEKKFLLTKKSFDHHNQLKKVDTIVFMGLVQWREEWWFSGIYTQQEFNRELVQEEKKSTKSKAAVAFLDHAQNAPEFLQKQEKAFLEFNNNAPIAFLPAEKIESFLNDYLAYYNASLNLSAEEREASTKRAKEKGYSLEEEEENKDLLDTEEPGLVFFNPESGCEIAVGINSAFPAKENPYYQEDESEDAVFRLFMSEDFSKELAMYCIDNYKDELPFFKEETGRKYLEDIDFLLRFWKKENYHAVPSVTYF